MADNLFEGLPPPSEAAPPPTPAEQPSSSIRKDASTAPPPPALKSALKRGKPPESQSEVGGSQKRLRFKTTTDATTAQVIEAMQKIASHIKNPSKFNKASKLAIQLIQSRSVKEGTSDLFFSILEAALSAPETCARPSLRADYQALFSAAEGVKESFSEQQKNQLIAWNIRVVVGNDLYTDDSFVFSKAAGKIKEAISSLPFATVVDDAEEAGSFEKAEKHMTDASAEDSKSSSSDQLPQTNVETCDPFGLDALLPEKSRDEKTKARKEALASKQDNKEELKRFLKSKRESVILCLETAARRYKTPWAQTVIDILAKHASDNMNRFTSRQRDAIQKLWNSIREQQTRRRQGKSVAGKLDMNAFEYLQEKYANEKISIRHAVGGGGERRAEQWLG